MRPLDGSQAGGGFTYKKAIVYVGLVLVLVLLYVRSLFSGPDPTLVDKPIKTYKFATTVDTQQQQSGGGGRQSSSSNLVVRTNVDDAVLNAKSSPGRLSPDGELGQDPLGPKPDLPPEPHLQLREWNQIYHGKRAALRKKQEAANSPPLAVHTFYTMDCTFHSLWQVLTLEMSWEEVGQGGFISRVISGCEKLKHKQPRMLHNVFKSPETEKRMGSFFAPTFSHLPSGEYYAPFNRPNGIWYWLNHSDITEDVLVLLDPDMFYIKRLQAHHFVKPSRPAAQFYGYMVMDFGRYQCDLCPKKGTYKNEDYAVGPPWLIRADDLRKMMPRWIGLVPALKKIDPHSWIVEMVAYSVAAAAEGFPHTIIWDGMVDNIAQARVWDATTNQLKENEADKPALIHYCFTWEVGEMPPKDQPAAEQQHIRMTKREFSRKQPVIDYYHWSKYRMPTDWPGGSPSYRHNLLDCKTPLMQEFHSFKALPKNSHSRDWQRTTQFLELTLPRLNEMLTRYKIKYCPDPATRNYHKLLRTSHPRYWISRYEIEDYRDGASVAFKEANLTLSGLEPSRHD